MTQSATENSEIRYKIGDVCRIADVQPYVLRYWESEFPLLAPDRSIPGPRTYNAREVELIGQIKRLLYDEGYTIAGAKKRIESEATGSRSRDTIPAFIPLEASPEKSGDRPVEKVARPPDRPPTRRAPSKSSAPAFETLPGMGEPGPIDTVPAIAPVQAPAVAPVAAADPRIARAVAELKEILGLLSRSEP